ESLAAAPGGKEWPRAPRGKCPHYIFHEWGGKRRSNCGICGRTVKFHGCGEPMFLKSNCPFPAAALKYLPLWAFSATTAASVRVRRSRRASVVEGDRGLRHALPKIWVNLTTHSPPALFPSLNGGKPLRRPLIESAMRWRPTSA